MQWQSLLTNRTKRTQSGKFIVQGVRPINAVIAQNWEIESLLFLSGKLSDWAKGIISQGMKCKYYELSPEIMKELGEKNESVPELIAIVKSRDTSLSKIKLSNLRSKMVLVLDRPQNPGNIGAVVRSADALGASMVVITGHSADIYDPKAIRASRGSLFALSVTLAASPADFKAWLSQQKTNFSIVGLSKDAGQILWDYDLTKPTAIIVGNETWGLSKQWKEACTNLASIPMHGTASSLNAASSAAISLYEYSRQTHH